MTFRRILAGLIGIPLALFIVAFAIANRQDVTVGFDPFARETPALSFDIPLFAVVLIALMLGVLIGGVASWARQGKWRRETRRRREEVMRLEAETETARREAAAARHVALPAPPAAQRAA